MELFHGSTDIVREPRYGFGRATNDYGRGFYCTQSKELASEWACGRDAVDGYVNRYVLDMDGLRIFDLNATQPEVLVWVATLMRNRRVNYTTGIDRAGAELFVQAYAADLSECDVAVGWRADDSYFDIVRAFCRNQLSVESLGRALRLGNLGKQVVLKSECAFERISFCGAERVDINVWNSRRQKRSREAYRAFVELSNADPLKGGRYYLDIVRELGL